MSDTALVLVDVKNDYFADGKNPLVGIDAAAANAARLLQGARDAGNLIIHVRHEVPSDAAPYFVPGSHGAQIHSGVAPGDNEAVITKNFPNSFRQTDLKKMLDAQEIKNVTICGR